MGIEVWSSDDAGAVLERAEDLLVAEPVLHNLVLTLLHGRIDRPEPGRYWVASDGGTPVGLVFQSPLDFVATVTPMPDDGVDAMVAAIVEQGADLPGGERRRPHYSPLCRPVDRGEQIGGDTRDGPTHLRARRALVAVRASGSFSRLHPTGSTP